MSFHFLYVNNKTHLLLNYRERGARALEERLAAERLAAAGRSEESHTDASENV